MSQWRGQIEDIEEPRDLVPVVGKYYHIPALLVLVVFMLWSRVRDWTEFVVDGTVYFGGNDPWYHYRMVAYTVRHWPETSPFDPWTYFPYGTHSSQFGTIYDQLMATAALVVGLGNPSDQTVRMVVLFAPAVLGAATAIPAYYVAKRMAGRFGGVVAVGVMALFGSLFVSRGTVGFADHHIAEIFFQTIAVLATMVAVSVAEEEKPVWELFQARDVAAVRRPVGWAVVAGAASAAYIWTWPPGVFLVGILGVYYMVELSSLQAHGESPEPVAIVGAISLSTTGLLTMAAMEEINVSATGFNLLQPGLAFAVAAGVVFMAWLARAWDDRDLANYQYPVAVVAILALLAGVLAVALPDIFDFLVDQTMRVIGLGNDATRATIGEAQPLPFNQLFPRYRFTIFIALAGVAYLGLKHVLSKPRPELTLVGIWTVFMLLATLTQRRFDYYLGVTVAVMVGYTIATVADFGGLLDSLEDLDVYQALAVAAIVLVVFAPLVFTSSGVLSMQMTASPQGPGQGTLAWNESMAWMDDNTPVEGNLKGAGNQERMDFYGTFENTEDYDYEAGFYGVLSWWDYGHWITMMSERIPTANPFQLGADQAANFLLSTTEESANDVLAELKDGNGTQTRYVVVDWKMAATEQVFRNAGGSINLNGKYFAPFQFTSKNVTENEYYESVLYQTGRQQQSAQSSAQYRTFMRHKQPYYESMTTRLYQFHGSAIEPQPVVLDWDTKTINGRSYPVSNGIKRFNGNMSAAREYVANDPTSQIGGVGTYTQERVPALNHYRLVSTSETSAPSSSQRYLLALRKIARGAFQQPLRTQAGLNQRVLNQIHYGHPQWVKVFERVPGATIRGQGAPANATVELAVRMNVPASNTSFVYHQQTTANADGEFTMTVPYSTTGYEKWGPEEGYTDVQVRADGPYQFRTEPISGGNGTSYRLTGSTHVTEGQVIGEADSSPTVTLERGNATVSGTQGSAATGNGTAAGDQATANGTDATATDATATPSNGTNSLGGRSGAESLPAVAATLLGLPALGAFAFRRGS